FDFGSKKKVVCRAVEVERLHSHAVPREHKTLLGSGPDRQSKHSSQPGKAFGIPCQKCMQDDFGIACRNEPVAHTSKAATQFRVVINFSVEYKDGVAVTAGEGLFSSGEIDDSETRSPQRHVRRFIDALLVRTTVRERTYGI